MALVTQLYNVPGHICVEIHSMISFYHFITLFRDMFLNLKYKILYYNWLLTLVCVRNGPSSLWSESGMVRIRYSPSSPVTITEVKIQVQILYNKISYAHIDMFSLTERLSSSCSSPLSQLPLSRNTFWSGVTKVICI